MKEPDASLDAKLGSSAYVVLHGDMHIRNGYPVYQVMPLPVETRPVPANKARQQPSRLLAAESRVVAFTGRERELAELAAWRDSSEPGDSVLLMYAPGGQGKSRLAWQFAVDSDTRGWTAWVAHHLSDPTFQQVVVLGDSGRALVLIVDYADRWPVDDLLLLLQNPLLRRPQRARVLLVARQAGSWWASLRSRLDKTDVDVSGSMQLSPLAKTALERRASFTTAYNAFAAVFGIPAEPALDPGTLEGEDSHLVLTLHMAALVAVDAHWRGATVPSDPEGLSAYLLDREHDFWNALHDHEQVATAPQVMARTVYTATLTRNLRRDHAVAVLDRVGIATADTADRVLDDHAVCYPPLSLNTSTALEALYPDRLGEDFLALQTPGHAISDYVPDKWTARVPARLLSLDSYSPDALLPVYARPAAAVLIDTARRWRHVAEQQLYPLLRAYPQIAVAAGGTALAALADMEHLPMDVLERINAALPAEPHVDLDAGAAVIAKRLTDHRLANTSDPATRASLLEYLERRLSNAALYDQALPAAEAVVNETRRQLTPINPETYQATLADSLNTLCIALTRVGRHSEARVAAEEAAQTWRSLAATNPIYHAHLAESLSTLASCLQEAERWEEALGAAKRAVEIQRRMAAEAPTSEVYAHQLIASLSTFSQALLDVGRHADATAAVDEAVETWRGMSAGGPKILESDLADSLDRIFVDLAGVEQWDDALSVATHVVELRRRLAATDPAVQEPDLADTLNNLSALLSRMGRHVDALAASEEAVGIHRRLAQVNPVAYDNELARSLDGLANDLFELGRDNEALAATENATEIWRRIALVNPLVHEPDLADSLTNLTLILTRMEHHADALTPAKEVVNIRRRFASANPTAYQRLEVATSLANLSTILTNLRQEADALTAAEDAVHIWRRLVHALDRVPPTLADSLGALQALLVLLLTKLGRADEADEVNRLSFEEDVELRDEPIGDDADTTNSILDRVRVGDDLL